MSADASDLYALSRDLGKTGPRLARDLYGTYKEAATDLRDEWKRNARQTVGEHARFYPDAITADMRIGLNIEAEIGPVVHPGRREQGFLAAVLEYGGVHTPGYFHGQIATDRMVPLIERRIDSVIDDVFGEVGL